MFEISEKKFLYRAPTLGRGIARGRFRLGRTGFVFSGDCWGAFSCCGRGLLEDVAGDFTLGAHCVDGDDGSLDVAFVSASAAPQRFAVDGNLMVSEDDSGMLEMVDSALAENIGIVGFKNTCEGVVARHAVGKGDPFVEPFEPDFVELLHEVVGFHATQDASEGDEDDFAEVVESVAAGAGGLDFLIGLEI